jgi:hypothetical protein
MVVKVDCISKEKTANWVVGSGMVEGYLMRMFYMRGATKAEIARDLAEKYCRELGK